MRTLTNVTMIVLIATVSVLAAPNMKVQVQNLRTGEYFATPVDGPIGIYAEGETFQTFCLEREENIRSRVYFAELGDRSIDGGVLPPGVGDPLDERTAFLYNEFLTGSLQANTSFDGGYPSVETLQNVIWHIEGEGSVIGMNSGLTAELLAYANENANGFYGIKVMVLTEADGTKIQDLLVKIPAPGSLILASLGMSVVSWLRKKKA